MLGKLKCMTPVLQPESFKSMEGCLWRSCQEQQEFWGGPLCVLLGSGVGPGSQRRRTPTTCLRSKEPSHPLQNFLGQTCKTHLWQTAVFIGVHRPIRALNHTPRGILGFHSFWDGLPWSNFSISLSLGKGHVAALASSLLASARLGHELHSPGKHLFQRLCTKQRSTQGMSRLLLLDSSSCEWGGRGWRERGAVEWPQHPLRPHFICTVLTTASSFQV